MVCREICSADGHPQVGSRLLGTLAVRVLSAQVRSAAESCGREQPLGADAAVGAAGVFSRPPQW